MSGSVDNPQPTHTGAGPGSNPAAPLQPAVLFRTTFYSSPRFLSKHPVTNKSLPEMRMFQERQPVGSSEHELRPKLFVKHTTTRAGK